VDVLIFLYKLILLAECCNVCHRENKGDELAECLVRERFTTSSKDSQPKCRCSLVSKQHVEKW